MARKVLVTKKDDQVTFDIVHMRPLTDLYFDIEEWDETKKYSPEHHVMVSQGDRSLPWYGKYEEQGFKIIINPMLESTVEKTELQSNKLILRSEHHTWLSESLWWKSMGQDQYRPQRTGKNSFLMLMRGAKSHRDALFHRLSDCLENALYSYVERGINIDGDGDNLWGLADGVWYGSWNRYLNPDWYNNTSFSVAVETRTAVPTFVTEKTYKATAFYHPFIIWGSPHSLECIHKQGFQSFGHIIDQSYDTITDNVKRLDCVVKETKRLAQDHRRIFSDPYTMEILEHNHNHFFSESIQQRYVDEVLMQIVKFIET